MRMILNGYVVSDDDAWIYRLFGFTVFCPKDLRAAIKQATEAGEELTLEINSGGGSVWSGFEMYSILAAAKCHTVAEVQSLSGSATSILMLGADEINLSPVAQVMIHLPSTMTEGDRYDHFDSIAVLDSITESCVNAYLLRSGGKMTRDEIRTKMTATTWLTAQDAVAAGLADHIIGDDGQGIDLNRIVAAAGGLPDVQKLRAQYLEAHPEGVPKDGSEPQPGADPPPSDPAGAEPAQNTAQAAMDRLAIEKARYGGF